MNQPIHLRVLTLIVFTNLALLSVVNAQFDDTFYGSGSGASVTTGNDNSGFGADALALNTAGSGNTATGTFALFVNTTSSNNTATGYQVLYNNTTGNSNTAGGQSALVSNKTGSNNTANGASALAINTAGFNNTATGYQALYNNTTGTWNTAHGVNALYSNTTGSSDVAIGANAGKNLTTGHGNVCIGVNVLGVAGESDTTRIKNVYSSTASGRAVYVNADAKIGTLSSSRRYKEKIEPMDKASETLFALKPVTFHYKKEIDRAQAPSFGLIAEDVAQVSPDLITRDEEGKPETVRYEAVNAMLLNEFLKAHRRIEEQDKRIDQLTAQLHHQVQDLKATVAGQQKQIEALTAGLQKVSAQLEASRPVPQIVKNNQ